MLVIQRSDHRGLSPSVLHSVRLDKTDDVGTRHNNDSLRQPRISSTSFDFSRKRSGNPFLVREPQNRSTVSVRSFRRSHSVLIKYRNRKLGLRFGVPLWD